MIDINAKAQEISEQLGLKEAARQDALAGIPAESAESLTGVEILAMAEVTKTGERYLGVLDDHCGCVREKLSQCKKSMQDGLALRNGPISEPPDSGNRDLARQGYINASTAYTRFKADNNLTRGASGDDRQAQILWAVIIMAMEGVFNSFFFAGTSAFGWLGGFFTAFVVSLINVSFAFLAGVLGLRYIMNHYSPAAKFGGLLWFVACLSVSMATVAMSAWLRGHLDVEDLTTSQIASQDAPQTTKIIMQNAWNNATNSFGKAEMSGLVVSFNSSALGMVGVLCAICGVWKGYEYDDPYPGFGVMLRNREEAYEHKEEAERKYKHAVDESQRKRIQPFIRAEATLEKSITALSVELRGMQRARSGDLPEQMVQLANVLLSEYRRNNAVGRSNLPAYFNRNTEREAFAELDAAFIHARKMADSLQTESDSILEECRELQQKLQAQAA